jgi:protein-disulfide isomerase
MKLWLIIIAFAFAGCTSKDQLKKMMKENPDIITEAIEENPEKFIEALNNAVKKAQGDQAKKREEDEKKELEESFKNPLTAEIRSDESIRGTKGAPITLIEYSDFECPFCSRGYQTVLSLLKKYEGKIQFVYKHLPLNFHPQAMIASQYYEAIRLQSADKAFKFHDEVYKEQKKLQNGETFLKAVAKSVGADMNKLAKDINSEAVKTRIEQDMEEAAKFGFQGTPGFLLNGIPIRGAYPQQYFEEMIEELKKRGLVKL